MPFVICSCTAPKLSLSSKQAKKESNYCRKSDWILGNTQRQVYERKAIVAWLLSHNTSPLTGATLSSKALVWFSSCNSQILEYIGMLLLRPLPCFKLGSILQTQAWSLGWILPAKCKHWMMPCWCKISAGFSSSQNLKLGWECKFNALLDSPQHLRVAEIWSGF